MTAARFDPGQPHQAEQQPGQQQHAAHDDGRHIVADRGQFHRAQGLVAHVDQDEQHQPGRAHREQPARRRTGPQAPYQGQPRARANCRQQSNPERGHDHRLERYGDDQPQVKQSDRRWAGL